MASNTWQPSPLTRRQLLQAGSLAAAGSVLGSINPLSAIEPIKRNGKHKFKYSLAAYSYREYLTGKNQSLTLFDFIDDCAKMQLEGTELTSYYFPNPVTPEYLRSLRHHCFRLGLDVSGTAVGNDFGSNDDAIRRQQIDSVRQWIDHAEILGAPVIRIFAGHVPKENSSDDALKQTHKRMVEGMEECCDYAGKHGIYLALENHGGPTATPAGLLEFVHDIKSPWFGVNLDTGNFRSDDVYGDLAKIAPYAINVQVKVVITQRGEKEPMDYSKCAAILKDAGYRGYVVLEYEEKDDPRANCPIHLEQMIAAFDS